MMSACRKRNSGARRWWMLARDPVSTLSTQTTRLPRRSSSSQRWEPRNPAPPVTRQVAMGREDNVGAMRLPRGELIELLGDAVPRDHSRQQLADAFARRIVAADGPLPDVLARGCGEGGSVELFRAGRPDVRWVGLEMADSPYAPRADADVRVYDGMTMPFADATFDAVYSKQVLEHVQDP